MLNTLKSLIAKSWKNVKTDLHPGKHYIDEEIVVRISGVVEKRPDELAAPTVSIPLIAALALFWERPGSPVALLCKCFDRHCSKR